MKYQNTYVNLFPFLHAGNCFWAIPSSSKWNTLQTRRSFHFNIVSLHTKSLEYIDIICPYPWKIQNGGFLTGLGSFGYLEKQKSFLPNLIGLTIHNKLKSSRFVIANHALVERVFLFLEQPMIRFYPSFRRNTAHYNTKSRCLEILQLHLIPTKTDSAALLGSITINEQSTQNFMFDMLYLTWDSVMEMQKRANN